MSKENRTPMGYKNEEAILKGLAPVIRRWARKLHMSEEEVQSSVAYLWKDSEREADHAYRNWLSENEIGPFGGR